MTAYYNEIDSYCVEWLRNLIREGLIADGQVDSRSISDVTPNDLKGFTQCHFFAGLGGWSGALRLAAWPDHREVWTGSCPCQPFSLAGKQGGFTDERHLWPHWHYLIQVCRPPTILGEQVASASAWLRLVRGDLEALDYAVGAIPIEAASAGEGDDGGPYHLRDRYWFVGHHQGDRRGEGWTEYEFRGWRNAVASPGGVGQADANHEGSQGRQLLPERAGERFARQNGLADANGQRQSERPQQHGGSNQSKQQTPCRHDIVRRGLADASSEQVGAAGQPRQHGHVGNSSIERGNGRESASESARRPGVENTGRYEWVVGADGKARRVKSGVRLLAHGVPARVAKLRALGNAIDLRPAAAFIKAVM